MSASRTLITRVLLFAHDPAANGVPVLAGSPLAGFGTGAIASLLGVAGGELRILTLILLYRHDIKTPAHCRLRKVFRRC